MTFGQMRRLGLVGAICGLTGLGVGGALGRAAYPPLDVLLSTTTTVIGQPFAYPSGTPQVTAAIVTMVPGQETGWHSHDAPLFAWMLEGELTVDYGAGGTRTYRAGDTLVEAFRTRHNGRNSGAGDVRLLAVFMGAEGTANTVTDTE
jgi:quercetin dioxygenase-like cupin family protein